MSVKILLLVLALWGCRKEDAQVRHVHERSAISWERSRVPPGSIGRAVRVSYGEAEFHGVVESGSWLSAALVRAANWVEPEGLPGSSRVVFEKIRTIREGKDGLGGTRDDRPFVDLRDVLERGRLNTKELGLVVQEALRGDFFPRGEDQWRVFRGVLFSQEEIQRVLKALHFRKTCENPVSVPRVFQQDLRERGVPASLEELETYKGVRAKHMMRWASLSKEELCD